MESTCLWQQAGQYRQAGFKLKDLGVGGEEVGKREGGMGEGVCVRVGEFQNSNAHIITSNWGISQPTRTASNVP